MRYYAEALGLEAECHFLAGRLEMMEFEDGVSYDKKELDLVRKMPENVKADLHKVKRIFGGKLWTIKNF